MTSSSRPNANGLLSSAAWNMMSMAITAMSGFITMPIIIRGIGADNFGLFSIIAMIGGFVALQDLGLGEATLRFVSKYYARNDLEGINRVLGATLSVYLLTGTLCCTSVMMFAPQIITLFKMQDYQIADAVLALRIASAGFLFSTIAAALQKVPEALLRYDISSKVGMVLTTIRCVMMIAVVKLGYGIVGLVWLMALNALAIMLIYGTVSCRLIPGLLWWPHLERSGLKEVFSYGVFSFTNAIIGNTSNYIDRFILGVFFGAAEVAYLTAPKELISRASGVPAAAGQALFPRFCGMNESKQDMVRLYVDSTWMLLCFSLVLFVPLTILLPEFLSLWISPEFSHNSATVAQLISIGSSVLGVTVPYFAYLKGNDKIHWLTVNYFISTGLSIVTAIILINMYGLLGAGIRSCLLPWTGVLFSMIVLKKGLNPAFFKSLVFRSTVLPILLSAACAWPVYYLWGALNYHGWLSIFLGYSVMAGLLAVLLTGIDLIVYKEKGAAGPLVNKAEIFIRASLIRATNNG